MKSFKRIFLYVTLIFIATLLLCNYVFISNKDKLYQYYLVEVNRAVQVIKEEGIASLDLSNYKDIVAIKAYERDNEEAFYQGANHLNYCIRNIKNQLYRFDYRVTYENKLPSYVILINCIIIVTFVGIMSLLVFLYTRIVKPFERVKTLPFELAKGHLVASIADQNSKYFGDFIWGLELLREYLEEQKMRELSLQRDKKTLVLSVSHDIKTPLSAIKLYSVALAKNLYQEEEKRKQIATSIEGKVDQIEELLSEIIRASHEDFMSLEVKVEEFYLYDLLAYIKDYYKDKLSLLHVELVINRDENCLLKGDFNRSVEVLQNVIENALKYGDQSTISIHVEKEEDARLICIENTGCTLSLNELTHIFDSFYRGSNVGNAKGSGLGLYICHQLMKKMDGEIYACMKGNKITVTSVFRCFS